ncbi:helix-turn-helix domain-containing protein [Telluribacter humicola]|uniref:helix-turn-helix domain-containing protein n=1 Tax=Telluribacter humicola TaxID=1720261 RepID=UPI001A975B6F|nr:helix-turn-helix domain-containing protein [Telluribacter humicola]
MLLKDFAPGPSVCSFVKCYRIIHFQFENEREIPFKAYPPKPEQVLHFFLKDPFVVQTASGNTTAPQNTLFAAQRTFLVNQYTGANPMNVQLVFQPTAVFRLTGIPAHELTNQYLDATYLFSKGLQPTYEQLLEAKSYTQLIQIVENFAQKLVNRAKKETIRLDAVCNQLSRMIDTPSLEALADQSCYSTRQFDRKFLERVGLHAHKYARIARFNRAYNIKNRFPEKDWSFIAAECGYYDYQHLVKDFKEFTGLTPSAFYALERSSPECVLGLTNDIYRSRYSASY